MHKINLANITTLARLFLVFAISALALYANASWQLLNPLLIIIMIGLDGLDGMIARARNETSLFGAIFDIATDRVIEITLWLVLAQLNIVSIWVAIIFVTRGILVDSLRNQHAAAKQAPFSIMQSKLGKFLVASRTMRFSYGFLKLITFAWLFALTPLTATWPEFWNMHLYAMQLLSTTLVALTVATCLARGIPVLVEAMM